MLQQDDPKLFDKLVNQLNIEKKMLEEWIGLNTKELKDWMDLNTQNLEKQVEKIKVPTVENISKALEKMSSSNISDIYKEEIKSLLKEINKDDTNILTILKKLENSIHKILFNACLHEKVRLLISISPDFE